MATNTYVALDKKTVTSAVGTVEFTNIPSTYTDLVLVFSGTAVSSDTMYYQFNGDTGSNYSDTYLFGDGSAGSGRHSNQGGIFGGGINTTKSQQILNIMNYASTTMNKSTLLRANASGITATSAFVGMWRSTAAITSIQLKIGANFAIGSTFSLYGIKSWSAESTPLATGGYITSDSTYWYHTFATSGTFTPTGTLTADVLVVAGGGGGGYDRGGGGGGGGLVYASSQSLSGAKTVVVGAGGAGSRANADKGANGSNTSFTGLTTATGGGGGGTYNSSSSVTEGANGGCGGGGASYPNSSPSFAGGTGSQGFNGGAGRVVSSSAYWPGGGGGMGSVGISGTVGESSGFSNTRSGGLGVTYFGNDYCAGGGAGTEATPYSYLWCKSGGASAGDGFGIGTSIAGHGLVSQGGGGGGGGGFGGNGGSGVVIVRYPKA
jgi:hypothetical protein